MEDKLTDTSSPQAKPKPALFAGSALAVNETPAEHKLHVEHWSIWAYSHAEALGLATQGTLDKHPGCKLVNIAMYDITEAALQALDWKPEYQS